VGTRVENVARRIWWGFPLSRPLAQARAKRINERHARRTIMSSSDLLEFWRQPSPPGNQPESFFEPVDRSRALLLLLEGLPKDARILEVGCNVGRNLAYLVDAGFTDVTGVEINQRAVGLLRENYPQLANSPIHVGAAEDVLPRLPGPFELIFTMAVLNHIHPQSTTVFDEIARLSRSVLAVEFAPVHKGVTDHQYPYDLQRTFERRGMRLRSIELLRDPRWQPNDLGDYAAWWFERG
jgi:SAM-dependent methyltransferase